MSKRTRRSPARKKRGSLNRYFVPGKHNDHRPEFLEYQALAINVAIVIMLFLIALGIQSLVFRAPSSQTAAVVASVLVDLANGDRAGSGLASLSVDPALQQAAQMKADDMAMKGYFAHTSPSGEDPWHWFRQAGYAFSFAGENLAVYFSDSVEVEKAWMSSPKHRANIMSDKFTEVGIALAHGTYEGTETTFVVQMFAAPAVALAKEGEAAMVNETTSPAGSQVAGASAEALETIVEDETFIAVKREVETLAAVNVAPQPIGAIKDGSSADPFMRLLASPKTTLQYIYMALGALVLFVLSLMLVRAARYLHIPSVFRGAALLALIAALLWSSSSISGQLLIL